MYCLPQRSLQYLVTDGTCCVTQERMHESPAPLAGEESVHSRSTRDMQGNTAAPLVDAKHEEDMHTGKQPQEQANDQRHTPQQVGLFD